MAITLRLYKQYQFFMQKGLQIQRRFFSVLTQGNKLRDNGQSSRCSIQQKQRSNILFRYEFLKTQTELFPLLSLFSLLINYRNLQETINNALFTLLNVMQTSTVKFLKQTTLQKTISIKRKHTKCECISKALYTIVCF